jgi:amino acid adenylation domain-containing protein
MEVDARSNETRQTAVRNDMGQYATWPAERDLPAGWSHTDCPSHGDALSYIEATWTTMSPSAAQRAAAGSDTLHGVFTRHALAAPSVIAVACGESTLTYGELEAHASALALRLQAIGVMTESVVALCVERGVGMIVAILAVLKAGAAYLPIDPAYPADRVDFMVEDSGARVLVKSVGLTTLNESSFEHVVVVGDSTNVQAGLSWEAPGASAADLAYIIYTSGSTGRPKGVLVDHRNVLRLFTSTEALYGFGREDTWLLFHSYAFDFSVWEIFGALVHGGRLEVAPFEATRSPDALIDLLQGSRVTVLNQTPSAFFQLARAIEQVASPPALALRYVIFGGEALEVRRLKKWFAMYPPDMPRLVNMYGITETTVHVTHRTIVPTDVNGVPLSPIGAAIGDLTLHVLNEDLSPAFTGAVGELYVGGAGLARGYLNRPALTASRFIPDPFSGHSGSRLYRSGDMARRLANGDIEYLGRGDNQVKLRGYRIELGEIEARLTTHSAIDSAVVALVGAEEDRPRLCAWVLASGTAKPSSVGLRTHLGTDLPVFMIPADYIYVDQWPLTHNGKLDKSRLPRPSADATNPTSPCGDSPLLAVIGEVLGRSVRSDENFFAAGGDSMLAVKIAHIARKIGLRVAVPDILHASTLGEVPHATPATHAEQPPGRGVPSRPTALPPGFVDVYPLTPMQATMVKEYHRASPTAQGIYHFQQWFRLVDPSLSPDAMAHAIRHIAAEEPVLRTRLVEIDGETHQAVSSESLPTLERIDGSETPFERHGTVIEDVARDDRRRALGSTHDPSLARYYWVTFSPTSAILFLSIHHAIDDGWGNQQFLGRLFDLYESYKSGAAPAVRIRPNSFRQHVDLVRAARSSTEEAAYWSHVVADLPDAPALVPTDVQDEIGEASLLLDPATVALALSAVRQAGVSLKTVALLALGDVLSTALRMPRIAVAVVTNGRSDALDDPLGALGLFWNLAPTEVPLTDDSHLVLAKKAQERLTALDAHSLYPAWDDLPDAKKPVCAFNYLNFHNRFNADGTGLALLAGDRDKFHLPLTAVLSVGVDGTDATIHFDGDPRVFAEAALASMCRAFSEALARLSRKLVIEEGITHA